MLSDKAIQALRPDPDRPRYCRDMREKLDHFVIPALGQLDIEAITRSDIETRLLAPCRSPRRRGCCLTCSGRSPAIPIWSFTPPNHRGNGELRVMSNGCLSMLLRRMGFQGRQTPHGFRGFGQTNCIEQLKIPRVVTEKQLAHADGNSVSRAYDSALQVA